MNGTAEHELDRFDFHPVIRTWFHQKFGAPTAVQLQAWEHICQGGHVLISSPTGSGKTLAALLPCISALAQRKAAARNSWEAGVRVLYVTPLKALNNDIRHHVVRFTDEMAHTAEQMMQNELSAHRVDQADAGGPANDGLLWPGITVGVRTGDTSQSTRASMLRRPPDVLVTTPESLYLLLTSPRARDMLRTVQHIIVDEIHDIAADKRGMHLSLTLERLAEWCGRCPQRIGVSATQKPIEVMARFLGGWEGEQPRSVQIVEHRGDKQYALQVCLPEPLAAATSAEDAVWTPLVRRVLGLIEGSRTALVFVNSRRLSERLTMRLNEQAGGELARAHHGSMAKEQRLEVETLLKEGRLRCLVATSSLELGIDVGHVDLVIQIDSPASAAAALQRIGRAGHSAGAVSRAALLSRSRGGLAELAALARRVAARDIEALRIPRHGLDVLAQQIVAMLAAGDDWNTARLERLLSRSDCYRGLPAKRLEAVLEMLSGFYPFVRPLIEWDRASGRLSRLPAAPMAALLGAGTIPQRSAYPVHHHETGVHLGELDEEYVHESQVGDVFQLGTSSWRIQRIREDRVYVAETVNRYSEIPFWRGETGGRTLEFSRDVGRLWRELDERLGDLPAAAIDTNGSTNTHSYTCTETNTYAEGLSPHSETELKTAEWLGDSYFVEPEAAAQLIRLARAQRAHTPLPTDRTLVLEQFTDEQHRVHFVIHSLFGRIMNRTWLLAMLTKLGRTGIQPVHTAAKDNGIELVFAFRERVDEARGAILSMGPDEARTLIVEAAAASPYFAASFRQLAETSLLLSRSFTRTPAWVKRLRSEELLKEAMPFKDRFPLLAEALRESLERKLDVPAMLEVLEGLQGGAVAWAVRYTHVPSPMTAQYQFDYVSANIYESDALPKDVQIELAGISRKLAEETFGPSAGPRLDPKVLEEERERLEQPELHMDAEAARDIVRLLKERGDQSEDELRRFFDDQQDAWRDRMMSDPSVSTVQLRGETRYIAADEASTYAALPDDRDAVMFVLKRFAETRFSFHTGHITDRYPLTEHQAERWVAEAENLELIQRAPFAHSEEEDLWMSAKAAARIIRLSIRTFRASTEGIQGEAYARKLLSLQHIQSANASGSSEALKEAIRSLQGWFAPVSHWESTLLPARVPDYRKEQLDLLCASGEVLWIGRKTGGDKEGSVALFLAEDKALYAPLLQHAAQPSAHPELLALLRSKGASFLTKLSLDAALPPSAALAQLLDLAWAGLVSNDQFAPLRESMQSGSRKADKFRSGLGRWYVLEPDQAQAGCSPAQSILAEETYAMSWARHLLDRYGVVSKPLVSALCPLAWEQMLGAFKRLELLGHVARGLFLKEVQSLQFAEPQLLQELNAAPAVEDRDERQSVQAASPEPFVLLSAADPANAYGWLLPWPASSKTATYARKQGNWIVWRGGRWTLWLENGGRRIAAPSAASLPPEQELRGVLKLCMRRQGLRKIVVDSWNGSPIAETPEGALLQSLGAERNRSSLILWPSQLG